MKNISYIHAMSNNRARHNAPDVATVEAETQKIQIGLMEGNLRHMLDRVDGFKKAKAKLEKERKNKIVTKETIEQEESAKEFGRFMEFTDIFGEFNPFYSNVYGEGLFLGPVKPFRYDIYVYPDGTREVKYRNIRFLWPLRILQQIYAWSKRKDIIIGN